MTPLKSLILVGIALFSAIASVQADLTINNPIAGTVWTAGKPATITWINGGTDLTAIDLVLRKGDANNLATIATIASGIDPGALSYTYDVPSTLANGNDYTVGIGSGQNLFYSHFFTITGGSGSNTTSTTANTTNTSSTTSSTTTSSTTTTSTTTSTSKTSSTPQSTSLTTVTTNRPTPTQNSVPSPVSSSSSIEVNVIRSVIFAVFVIAFVGLVTEKNCN